MFIITLTYQKNLDEVERHLADHISFLDKYYASGHFICSGRKNPRTGGVILAHRTNREDIKRIIQEDPFYQHQTASYEIIEMIPTKFDKHLKDLFTEDYHWL